MKELKSMVSQVTRVEDFSPQDEVNTLGKVQCLPFTCCVLILQIQKQEEVVSCSHSHVSHSSYSSHRSETDQIFVSQVFMDEGTHLCTGGKCVFFVHDTGLGTGLGCARLFRVSG